MDVVVVGSVDCKVDFAVGFGACEGGGCVAEAALWSGDVGKRRDVLRLACFVAETSGVGEHAHHEVIRSGVFHNVKRNKGTCFAGSNVGFGEGISVVADFVGIHAVAVFGRAFHNALGKLDLVPAYVRACVCGGNGQACGRVDFNIGIGRGFNKRLVAAVVNRIGGDLNNVAVLKVATSVVSVVVAVVVVAHPTDIYGSCHRGNPFGRVCAQRKGTVVIIGVRITFQPASAVDAVFYDDVFNKLVVADIHGNDRGIVNVELARGVDDVADLGSAGIVKQLDGRGAEGADPNHIAAVEDIGLPSFHLNGSVLDELCIEDIVSFGTQIVFVIVSLYRHPVVVNAVGVLAVDYAVGDVDRAAAVAAHRIIFYLCVVKDMIEEIVHHLVGEINALPIRDEHVADLLSCVAVKFGHKRLDIEAVGARCDVQKRKRRSLNFIGSDSEILVAPVGGVACGVGHANANVIGAGLNEFACVIGAETKLSVKPHIRLGIVIGRRLGEALGGSVNIAVLFAAAGEVADVQAVETTVIPCSEAGVTVAVAALAAPMGVYASDNGCCGVCAYGDVFFINIIK